LGKAKKRRNITRVDYRQLLETMRHPGAVTVTPSELVADTPATVTVTFAAKGRGLAKGSVIALVLPRDFGGHTKYHYPKGFVLGAKDVGYATSVEVTTDADARLDASISTSETSFMATMTVIYAAIAVVNVSVGKSVRFVLGGPKGHPCWVQAHSQRAPFIVAVSRARTEPFERAGNVAYAGVIGGWPERVFLHAPAVVGNRERVQVSAVAVDSANHNPTGVYDGGLVIRDGRRARHLPTVKNTASRAVLPGGLKPGIHRLSANAVGASACGRSNPIKVVKGRPAMRVYFGEIHSHTVVSDGSGTPEEAFAWARDARGLDFASIADHYLPNMGELATPSCKREYLRAFEEANRPGRFVTIPGYEWAVWGRGGTEGDKCVYFRDIKDVRFINPRSPSTDRPDKLTKRLRGVRALVIAHHTRVGNPTVWAAHEVGSIRLAEIYSTWGQSEEGGPHSVREGLAYGHRMGFTGGTDNHRGQPATGRSSPLEGAGITAVLAPRLTREAVFDALYARRSYATTGAKMLVLFTANGRQMGSEFREAPGSDITFDLEAHGTAEISLVELIRNGELIVAWEVGREDFETRFNEGADRRSAYYYFRITQADGQRAWTSPVWVDPAG